MLTVPERFHEGLVLLLGTPSGSAILDSANLAGARGVEMAALGAYGSAIDSTTIHLTNANIPAPNQACVLAHELTHCLDFAFWNVPRQDLTATMIGATEFNAHYNQGLISKELSMIPGLENTWAQQVQAMTGGASTFGHMFDTWERDDVYQYLTTTAQYGPSVDALRRNKILYLWTRDDQWENGTTMFHCEAHLDANSLSGPTW